jgi:glycosyltransferase 2 family protein
MDAVLRALDALVDEVAAIQWQFVALAAVAHVSKILVRTRAWRNIVAAALPESEVPWRTVLAGYAAGIGVNALIPARSGDLLRLFIVKRRIPGATYSTLAATLVVETLFDFTAALALFLWALSLGVLPGIDVLGFLPQVDWLWLFQHPRAALAASAAALVLGFGAGLWASTRVRAFRDRVASGFAILRTPREYFGHVLPWQTLDWALRLTTIYCMLRAFGLPATLHNALLVQAASSLATLLPLTPAGIGTEQALLAYVFAGIAPAADVLSFSVGLKLTIVAVNVAAGATALLITLRTLRWRRKLEAAAMP